ncbi:hypothetical protein ScPMuIL_002991 [Solemya velum]
MGPRAVLVCLLAIGVYYILTREPSRTEFPRNLNSTYDYVIVGGGSAGCVLANRLSEDGTSTVLLLEAGGDNIDNPQVSVPANLDANMFQEIDWGYRTEPQRHSHKAYIDQVSYWPRGKMLGGSSNMNFMIYMRGNPTDFDSWASEGATGWSYKEVLPYFLKSEDMTNDELKRSKYHSQGGPLKVSVPSVSPLRDVSLDAGRELGYKFIDCNGGPGDQQGFCDIQATIGGGVRFGTDRAFLKPILGRANLHVGTDAHVTKVVTEKKKAIGVEFIRNGKKSSVGISKEIILSAGTIGSPQILLLSGIGPKKHLTEMKIPVVADLPVGENLEDHMATILQVDIARPYSVHPETLDSISTKLQYQLFGTGYYSSPGFCDTMATFTVNETNVSDMVLVLSSIQFRFWNSSYFRFFPTKIQKEIFGDAGRPSHGFNAYVLAPLRPKSRGTIRLRSTDPFDYPLLQSNYLQHPDDVKAIIHGLRSWHKIIQTEAMQAIGAVPADSKKPYSFCTGHEYASDAYFECYARHLSGTAYHHSSTCRMGATGDKNTVLDPELRVQGLKGLRVVDASSFPHVTSYNTNAPVIMLAEKAADLIRGIDSVKHLRRIEP